MNSLKKEEKRVAKKRQVYKPILENPFTAESKLWPHVEDQSLVIEVFQKDVLNRRKVLRELNDEPKDDCVMIGFNTVVERLSKGKDGNFILFVCNRDVPNVLVTQLPILCYTSQHNVLLVQLPKGSITRFCDAFRDEIHDGMCLVDVSSKYADTGKLIEQHVSKVSVPWLQSINFSDTPLKLLSTTQPSQKK